MTQREFLNSTISLAASVDSEIATAVLAEATARLTTLDEKNAARAAQPSKKSVENAPLKAEVFDYFTANPTAKLTAPQLVEAMGTAESFQKIGYLCRDLVSEGKLTAETVSVPKKGKQVAYTLAD